MYLKKEKLFIYLAIRYIFANKSKISEVKLKNLNISEIKSKNHDTLRKDR